MLADKEAWFFSYLGDGSCLHHILFAFPLAVSCGTVLEGFWFISYLLHI